MLSSREVKGQDELQGSNPQRGFNVFLKDILGFGQRCRQSRMSVSDVSAKSWITSITFEKCVPITISVHAATTTKNVVMLNINANVNCTITPL